MFTKACEYGIRAMVVVAGYSLKEKRISLRNVAISINSPEAFTSKILQILVKRKLLNSIKGINGGFEIPQDTIHNIRLKDIIDAIDGDEKYMSCVLGLKECSDKNPCPAHKNYKHIKAKLINMLETTTLVEMVKDTQSGEAYLKIMKIDQ